jgi:predicted TIM-barrel fold metal-dependent hydrolase
MALRSDLSDIVIIDADVHVNDTPGALAPYCDMPWRLSLEAAQRLPHRYLSIPGYAPEFGGSLPVWPGGHKENRSVNSAAEMREQLSSLGVDVGIMFPDNLLLLATFPQRKYAAAIARAYNAWLLDNWCDKEQGLKGLIVAAPQDPADAAREIEKYKNEAGIVGVYLPCAGLPVLYGDEKYDPLFAAAEEAGLPILLHAVQTLNSAYPFNGLEQFETKFGRHALSHSLSLMMNMLRMIVTGVPARYPDLKIAFIEGGLSWVPFMRMRLDKEYVERRREIPFYGGRPSQAIAKFYFGTQPVEEPEIHKILQS